MPSINIRLTANSDANARLLKAARAIDGVVHAEEVADLMPGIGDEDSSSAGLPDDTGPGSHAIVVEADTERAATLVRRVAEEFAANEGVAVEFVDRR